MMEVLEAKPTGKEQTAVSSDGGNMAVFVGSTPNVGTTLIALGTALQLAVRTDSRVGLMCLNLKSSKLHRYMGGDEALFGLDSVRAEMRSGSLNSSRLQSCFRPVKGCPNLDVLYGTLQREQAEFFQPGDIRHLLGVAQKTYDVCLVDVSAYWDNAATIAALMDANQRVLVTTPDMGHFQEDLDRGLKTMAPIFGIAPESFLLAVNQYNAKGSGGINTGDIRKETGMELAAVVSYDPSLTDWANQGRLAEYAARNKGFVQAVRPLGEALAERFGLMLRPCAPSLHLGNWRPIFGSR